MGLRDFLGWDWKSKAGLPIVNVPGCPVHRIQECHVAAYHILWDLVHTLLADNRGAAAGGSSL